MTILYFMSDQAMLPGISEWNTCQRCGGTPLLRYWTGDDDIPCMNVSCQCRTISGVADGMIETWNHAASKAGIYD